MPIDLVAPHPARAKRRTRPAMTLAAQLIAVVLLAAASITLESVANDSLAGSAQQEIAGP